MSIKTQRISNKETQILNGSSIYGKTNWNIKIHMFSRNSIYLFPHDSALPTHINGDYEHVFRYSFFIKKTNWIEFSFGAMSSPNIADITFLLNKTFPSPTTELVLSSHRCSVKLNSYSTNKLKNYVINDNTRYSENLKSNW